MKLYKVIYRYHLNGHAINKYSSPAYICEDMYNVYKQKLQENGEFHTMFHGNMIYINNMFVEKKMEGVV